MPAPRAKAEQHLRSADVSIDDGDWSWLKDPEASINLAIQAIPRSVVGRAKGARVAISLSSDSVVADLNGRYRGKPKPTNVLSFPSGAKTEEKFLGDIIVADETVRREAKENSVSPEHHLQHLIVHGVLHLLGYDHETVADAERMEALEIEILASIGIANPYTEPLEDAKTKATGDSPAPRKR